MTIFVDNFFFEAKGKIWCHLFSDKLDAEELHQFAKKVGLKRQWCHVAKCKLWEAELHYDVTEYMRERALKLGAVSVDTKKLVEVVQRKRELLNQPKLAQGELMPAPVRYE